jgi:hypothetical protein
VSRAVAYVISPITGESIIDASAPCLTGKVILAEINLGEKVSFA